MEKKRRGSILLFVPRKRPLQKHLGLVLYFCFGRSSSKITVVLCQTHPACFLVAVADVRQGAEVAPPLLTISVTHTCAHTHVHTHSVDVSVLRAAESVVTTVSDASPVLALKYDESASSRETERPMSTEGSHSRCSWVGEGGEGGEEGK